MDIKIGLRWAFLLCWPLLSCQSQKSAVSPAANTTGGLAGHVYYVDPGAGSDNNDGKSLSHPFATLARLQGVGLAAGDTVRLRRGATFVGPWLIRASGLPDRPIVITDYGDPAAKAPSFTNTVFVKGNYGNCIRIGGSYVVVEKMYCHSAAAYVRGEYTPVSGWDTTVWEMGYLYREECGTLCRAE